MIRIIRNRLKTTRKSIPFLLLLLWSPVVLGSAMNGDSLRFEVLVTNKMLNDVHINGKLIRAVDISADRLALLSTADQFYLAGWGGIIPLGNKSSGNISSFAFTPEYLLMAIRKNELCTLDSLGNLNKLFTLPADGMGISAGKYVMYVYDRNKSRNKNALYVIARGGKYTKLIELPAPIASVVEMKNSILFTNENGLFSYNLRNKDLKAVATVPKGKEIISIAVDTAKNRIYFSTEENIYTIKDSKAVIITDQAGGTLRFFNDGLIVFNAEKKVLVRIAGIENEIIAEKKAVKPLVVEKHTADTLTNTRVIDMVKAELSDDLIIRVINSSPVNFDMSVDGMISLSNQKVSSAVIKAMKNAMKKRSGPAPNENNR